MERDAMKNYTASERIIQIRTASGSIKEQVQLIRLERFGFRHSHNPDGIFERFVGWDAHGTKYETSSRRGWRRALDQTGGEA